MGIKKLEIVKFAPRGEKSFYESVIADVNAYFETNNISPYANAEMWIKTVSMVLLFFVPYAFMVSGMLAGNIWVYLGMWLLMGVGMVGIGTSVMHDANHGAYSPNKTVNKVIGSILEVIGGYSATWRIQHNILHHTYTNVEGLDEDIDSGIILRFSPRQKRYWFHRYQHFYAWFFYSVMTLFWMTAKDYLQVIRYNKFGLLKKEKVTLAQAIQRITMVKIVYYSYALVLPLIFSGMPWYTVILGFVIMHAIAGVALSLIFQPAHVVESSDYAMPVEHEGRKQMENSWAIHEVANTTDFAPRNRILNWFIGGLNFQIEHHLFSGICHVHYRKLAPIVKAATESYGIPYQVVPTFRGAIAEHLRMLRKLGRE